MGSFLVAVEGSFPRRESTESIRTVPADRTRNSRSHVGADQHGQDPTKACVRAARNAIEFNSLPAINRLVPGGYDAMKLGIDIAVPSAHHAAVDLDAVAKVFPYGNAAVRLQEGGAVFGSGIALPATEFCVGVLFSFFYIYC